MSDTPGNPAAIALVNTIKRRIESRYTRILFVHKELAGLDAAANHQKKGTKGESFEDFVFSRIDFSVYKKIDAKEFLLLLDEGLSDYTEAFYKKAFNMNVDEVRGVITSSYIRAGPFYLCKKAGPLLLSIMRTLHTSLEFAPLLDTSEFSGIEQLRLMAELLDGTVIRHSDNSETKLFVPAVNSAEISGSQNGESSGEPLLCGTFYPFGKAYTITLIPAPNTATLTVP
jgi:hypothetical protein